MKLIKIKKRKMEFNRVSHALRTILGMNKKFPGYRELFLEGCVKGGLKKPGNSFKREIRF